MRKFKNDFELECYLGQAGTSELRGDLREALQTLNAFSGWYTSFSEMLDPAILGQIGISAEGDIHQCITRICAAYDEQRKQIDRALERVAGVDYREGHFRDNLTPDELRDVILGLAVQIEKNNREMEQLRTTIGYRDMHNKQLQQEVRDSHTVLRNIQELHDLKELQDVICNEREAKKK